MPKSKEFITTISKEHQRQVLPYKQIINEREQDKQSELKSVSSIQRAQT